MDPGPPETDPLFLDRHLSRDDLDGMGTKKLKRKVMSQQVQLAELEGTVEYLKQRVAELEERNSSCGSVLMRRRRQTGSWCQPRTRGGMTAMTAGVKRCPGAGSNG